MTRAFNSSLLERRGFFRTYVSARTVDSCSVKAPPPSPVPVQTLQYEAIDVTDRTSAVARNSFRFWLLLLLAHTAAGYGLAHVSRSVPSAPLPGAVAWFGIMAVGCLVLLVTWRMVGSRERHRGWDGFIWLMIAPTCAVGLVFDTVHCLVAYFGD